MHAGPCQFLNSVNPPLIEGAFSSAPCNANSVKQEVRPWVAKKLKVPHEVLVEAADVPLADAGEVALHFGAVVARDARRDGGVGHQAVDASRLEDVGRIAIQRLVVAHCVVIDVARGAQLHVRYPVDHVLPKLFVQSLLANGVAQVAHKVLEAQSWGVSGGARILSVLAHLAVLADDGGRNVMLVPGFRAWVLHKLVLVGGNDALERVTYDEELEVIVQSVSKNNKRQIKFNVM